MQRFDRYRIELCWSPEGKSRTITVTLSGGCLFRDITAVTVKRAVLFVLFESFAKRRYLVKVGT